MGKNKKLPVHGPYVGQLTQDKRGRTWERFVDDGYFGMVCIRCLSVENPRDFNAPMNFSFDLSSDADAFWAALPRIA